MHRSCFVFWRFAPVGGPPVIWMRAAHVHALGMDDCLLFVSLVCTVRTYYTFCVGVVSNVRRTKLEPPILDLVSSRPIAGFL